ncbi:hypothetical protein [Deinococcus sedimenti]|uniref:IclR-ED domain-containing protein n=1 Tax=Deinococcus sedimenti TaxID=1867090 RepID=A0ABQ2S9K9_9DEIO|nr:hypothetical protein [Deinococcus sedimenti]GGS10765.1 hypothetical protein GCM10008960_40990 [Deinococcus sedimenti]
MNATGATYRRPLGARLSPAEAAQLTVRAAQGEQLPAVPVRDAQGYVLTALTTLSANDLRDHQARVQEVARVLYLFQAPALLA